MGMRPFLALLVGLQACSDAGPSQPSGLETLRRVESALLEAKTLTFRYERRMRDADSRTQKVATGWETGFVSLSGLNEGRLDIADRETGDEFSFLSDGVRAGVVRRNALAYEYEAGVVRDWRELWILTLFRNGRTGGKPGQHTSLADKRGKVSDVTARSVTSGGVTQWVLEYKYENSDGYSPFRSRLWVEADTLLPVRLQIESRIGSEEYTATFAYDDWKVNQPVDRAAFRIPGTSSNRND